MASSRPRLRHPQPATRRRSKSRPPRPRTDRLQPASIRKKGGPRVALFAERRNSRDHLRFGQDKDQGPEPFPFRWNRIGLWIFVLTRFLDANRSPPRIK